MRYGEAGQSHLLPFLGAAALFAALTITAHSVVLGLAAVIAGIGLVILYRVVIRKRRK